MNKPLEREELDFIFDLYQPAEHAEIDSPGIEKRQQNTLAETDSKQEQAAAFNSYTTKLNLTILF